MNNAGISGEADLSNCKAVVKTLESTQRTDLAGDLKSAFATFDSNQDGSVSITELTHVLTSMGEKMDENAVNEVMHAHSTGATDQFGGLQYSIFSSLAASSVDSAI